MKSGTNYYVLPGVAFTNGAASGAYGFNTNNDTYFPHYTWTPLVVDQLAAEVVTLHAANNFRMGVYLADKDMQPMGGPLADSGDISTATTGVKTYTPGTPFVIPRGPFLTVINTTSGTLAMRAMRATGLMNGVDTTNLGQPVRAMYGARTYAAFTSPPTAWATADSNSTTIFGYPVYLRVSAA